MGSSDPPRIGSLVHAGTVVSSRLNQAVFLMGPTASGKSALALELLQRFPMEIIQVDSASIYRGMDIGTAKPEPSVLRRYPHHLIDILDPTETYSAARFREDALRLMQDIQSRQKIPLLVGGTFLYFKALCSGLSKLPAANPEIRLRLEDEAELSGWPELHDRLAQKDPVSAARISPNDGQRIQRALEVYELTGEPLSVLQLGDVPLKGDLLFLGILPEDRSALRVRIRRRFEAMLQAGLEQELRHLCLEYDLNPNLPSMRCVGYRQMWSYLQQELSWEQMRENGVIATNQLAKRQITWMRSWQNLNILPTVGAAQAATRQVADWVKTLSS